jgi:hypothetical protein
MAALAGESPSTTVSPSRPSPVTQSWNENPDLATSESDRLIAQPVLVANDQIVRQNLKLPQNAMNQDRLIV